MGIARMDLTSDLLRQLLNLPHDCSIIGSRDSRDANVVSVLVEHTSIPDSAIAVTAAFTRIGPVTHFERFDVTYHKQMQLIVGNKVICDLTPEQAESLCSLFRGADTKP